MSRTTTLALLLLAFVAAAARAQPEQNTRYAMAQRYEQNGDLPNAAKIYLELYRSSPSTRTYFEGVRRTYSGMLRFTDLLPIVQEQLTLHPRDGELGLLSAELLHRTGRRDEAAAAWSAVAEKQPNDPASWLRVAASQRTLNLYADALATLDRGRERMDVQRAYIIEHAELLARVGRVEEGIVEYSSLLREEPAQLPLVQRGLAPALEGEAAIRRAIATVRRELNRSSNTTLLQLLAWLHGEANDPDGTFAVVLQLDSLGNDNGSALYQLADRLAAEERWSQAARVYRALLDRHSGSPLAPNARLGLVRALEGEAGDPDLLDAAKRKELAERYLEIRGTPGVEKNLAAEATYRAARLLADQQPERALETLEGAGRTEGRVGLLHADILVRLGRMEAAEQLLRRMAYGGTEDTNASDGAALRLGQMQFYRAQFDSAMSTYVGLTNDPGTDVANDALEELALVQENLDRNDTALALYARARLALLQHRTGEADALLEQTMKRSPGTPLAERALMARAELRERTGGDALPLYLELVQSYPGGLFPDRALYRAARMMELSGKPSTEVGALYMRILSDYPTSPLLEDARTALQRLRPAP